MNFDPPNIALLPSGFVDLMPEDAEKEARAINSLMEIFEGYGYRRIKPPLLEFEDSLLAKGPGEALARDTFRLMDPVSHRMMGLRADITPQIARIVCTRLPREEGAMRLTYANDVLRTSAGQMRSSRQFTQVGCEIIRDDSAQSYAEALMLVILGLKALGLEDISIDLTIPRTLDLLIEALALSPEREQELRDKVGKRDRDGVLEMQEKGLEPVLELLLHSGDASAAIQKAGALSLPSVTGYLLNKLKQVCDLLKSNLEDLGIENVNLTFDPFETKGFEYQDGIAFTVFSKSIRGELGRGGYYDVRFGAMDESASEKAIGFTLYMDTIRPGVKFASDHKCIGVGRDVSWAEMEDLRGQGYRLMLVDDVKNAPPLCSFVYQNGKIEKSKS